VSRDLRYRMIGLPPEPATPQPTYTRVLGLRALQPSGTLCFLFFEGTIVLGALLALAELVPWWVMLVLPTVVAVMVKVNDLVASALADRPDRWLGDLTEP
jgi:hypothetical protein